MTATDTVAHWIALAILVLGAAAWACCRIRWRRDDRAANLAIGIADERRMALMVADPTPYEDDTVDLTEPVATLRERLIPVEPGFVMFRGGAVHKDCLGPYLRDGTRPCAGCAVHLDHVLTGAT